MRIAKATQANGSTVERCFGVGELPPRCRASREAAPPPGDGTAGGHAPAERDEGREPDEQARVDRLAEPRRDAADARRGHPERADDLLRRWLETIEVVVVVALEDVAFAVDTHDAVEHLRTAAADRRRGRRHRPRTAPADGRGRGRLRRASAPCCCRRRPRRRSRHRSARARGTDHPTSTQSRPATPPRTWTPRRDGPAARPAGRAITLSRPAAIAAS